ncbi:Hypothetical protein GLP15_4766 [Giardia lamblia P15]|uniref:Uncharacterized protein n=1 Tax=Giardia intestinalis (strain P15) TaxID=658858 RepID=E1F4I2_GIAIA|nr:Hypothetical protein GLP15_4766 [Giardia lamblia P15]
MTANPVVTSLLSTINEISQRQDTTMRFVERITKQLGHLKGVVESSQGPFPGSKMTKEELATSLGEILKYIEANLLETNDVRELLSSLEETLNGIGSSSDKALLKTKLSLGLSDCYLIMEGLLAAKDIGQYIMLTTDKDIKESTPSELGTDKQDDEQDDDLSIQVDILSESLADEVSSLTVGGKLLDPERRVKFDHDNGSSLSSLPESTVMTSLTSTYPAESPNSTKGTSKTSIQAKLEEFLAIRANAKQKKPEAITKLPPAVPQQHGKNPPISSLNLSVTSVDSNANDSLITEPAPLAVSASVLDPVEPQNGRQNIAPIQSLKTLESVSELEQRSSEKKHDIMVNSQQTSIKSNRNNKGCTGTNIRSGSTNRTPLRAINTPHQNVQTTHTAVRPSSVRKSKPIVLLDNVSLSIAASPQQIQAFELASHPVKNSPGKVSKRTPCSMPATPTKFISPKQSQAKSYYSTPTLTKPAPVQVGQLPSPPKLSSRSPSSGSPTTTSSQARLVIRTMEEKALKQDIIIKGLAAELQSMKRKVEDMQTDYKQQEEEVKQLLLESSKVQNEYEEKIRKLKEDLAEQKDLAIHWREKAQQWEEMNQALSHQIAMFKYNKDDSIIPISHGDSDSGNSEGTNSITDIYTHKIKGPVHFTSINQQASKIQNKPDYTTLSNEKYSKLEADYLNGYLGNYYNLKRGRCSQKNLSVIDLYRILGDYDRQITELTRSNKDLKEKLDVYQGLFRAISGTD